MTTRVFDRDFISIFVSAACEGRRHTTIKSASAFFLRVKIGHFHRTIRNKGDAFAVFSAGIFPYSTVRVVQYLTCGYEILPAPFVYRDGNNPLNKINEMKTAKFFMGVHRRRAARVMQRRQGLFGRFRADQGSGHAPVGTDGLRRRHAERTGRDLHHRRGMDLDDRRDPRRSARLDFDFARPRRCGRAATR